MGKDQCSVLSKIEVMICPLGFVDISPPRKLTEPSSSVCSLYANPYTSSGGGVVSQHLRSSMYLTVWLCFSAS